MCKTLYYYDLFSLLQQQHSHKYSTVVNLSCHFYSRPKCVRSKTPSFGNDFKKPIWYDEESDDELFDNNKAFGFQVFTNPMEIQKYHEQQMRRMLKTIRQFEGKLSALRNIRLRPHSNFK